MMFDPTYAKAGDRFTVYAPIALQMSGPIDGPDSRNCADIVAGERVKKINAGLTEKGLVASLVGEPEIDRGLQAFRYSVDVV